MQMQSMPRMGHLAACVRNGSFRFNRHGINTNAFIPMRSGVRTASASPDMQRIMMSQPSTAAMAIEGAPQGANAAISDQSAPGGVQQQLMGVLQNSTVVPTMVHEQLSDPVVQDEAMALGKVILLALPLVMVPMMYMKYDQLRQLRDVIQWNEEEKARIQARLLGNKDTMVGLSAKIEYLEKHPPLKKIKASAAHSPLSEGASGADMSVEGVLDAEKSDQSASTIYSIGTSVEVFSNSFNSWCPGKVIEIESSNEQTLLTLEFTWPSGEVATKKLAQDHQDLRVSVPWQTAKGVFDADEPAQDAGTKYALGASVEVFSNSFNIWCPGKVIEIESSNGQTLLTLEFTWPTGEVASKQLAQGCHELRVKP